MKLLLTTLTRHYARIGIGSPADHDPELVAAVVHAWRRALNKQLPHALDWNESPTGPFDEAVVGEGSWETWAAGADQLKLPSLWLPGEHDLLFMTDDLSDRRIWIGSSAEAHRLLAGTEAETIFRRSIEYALPVIRA